MARFTRRSSLKAATAPPVPRVVFLNVRDRGALRQRAREVPETRAAAFVSRSYCDPYALVAWHGSDVGVDIERVHAADGAFADVICTEDERARLGSVPDRDDYLASLWAGKEALAKALGDPLAYDPARLTSPEVWDGPSAGRWRARKLLVPEGHVAWLCWTDAA